MSHIMNTKILVLNFEILPSSEAAQVDLGYPKDWLSLDAAQM